MLNGAPLSYISVTLAVQIDRQVDRRIDKFRFIILQSYLQCVDLYISNIYSIRLFVYLSTSIFLRLSVYSSILRSISGRLFIDLNPSVSILLSSPLSLFAIRLFVYQRSISGRLFIDLSLFIYPALSLAVHRAVYLYPSILPSPQPSIM